MSEADLRLCFRKCKKPVFSRRGSFDSDTLRPYASFISSPESSGSQGELIVYPCSGVRRPSVIRRPSTISNIFSSEIAWPIKVNFYVEPPWEAGTKVYINGPGHMTKMATMPIYGKNLKKSSSPEPEVL